MQQETIYIAGPMKGYHRCNYDAFFAAEKILSSFFRVLNPARMDQEAGLDIDRLIEEWLERNVEQSTKSTEELSKIHWKAIEKHILETHFDLQAAIRRDIAAVLEADAIFLLDGWEKSEGATTEHKVAKWARKQIITQSPCQDYPAAKNDLTIEQNKLTKICILNQQ